MAYTFAAGATLALCVVFGAGYAFRAIDRRYPCLPHMREGELK